MARVHFKCIIIDGRLAYFGSANLTGAGMGAKSLRTRNFENGVWTDDPAMIAPLEEQFDAVWRGDFCKDCGRRDFCGDPVPLVSPCRIWQGAGMIRQKGASF